MTYSIPPRVLQALTHKLPVLYQAVQGKHGGRPVNGRSRYVVLSKTYGHYIAVYDYDNGWFYNKTIIDRYSRSVREAEFVTTGAGVTGRMIQLVYTFGYIGAVIARLNRDAAIAADAEQRVEVPSWVTG